GGPYPRGLIVELECSPQSSSWPRFSPQGGSSLTPGTAPLEAELMNAPVGSEATIPLVHAVAAGNAACFGETDLEWCLSGRIGADETVQDVPLLFTPFAIGRRGDVQLCLPAPTVSARHAVIEQRDGRLVITDLHSTNGTFVNGQRIAGPTALSENDLLQIA